MIFLGIYYLGNKDTKHLQFSIEQIIFCLIFHLTSVYFRGQSQHVDHVTDIRLLDALYRNIVIKNSLGVQFIIVEAVLVLRKYFLNLNIVFGMIYATFHL